MALYEVKPDGLVAVAPTSFAAEGIRERGDIQRLLRESIDCLDSGLLVIAEEFGAWADSARRIDLLCVDTDARLVVVELKRSDDGGHMELQALRYAAMVSAMTFSQAVMALARHRNPAAPDETAAQAELLVFLRWDEPDEDKFGDKTRIILAAADFSRELTTTVLWLLDTYQLDIRCVRIKPYRLNDGRVMLDVQTLIPLPETADYQTKLIEKQAAERREKSERHVLRYRFWEKLLSRARTRTELHAGRSPNDSTTITGPIEREGCRLVYGTNKEASRVELAIYSDPGVFEALEAQKAAIVDEFNGDLLWIAEVAGTEGARIRHVIAGGYRSPEQDWPRIQDEMVDAMIRLDRAIRPRLRTLRK